MFTSRIEWEWSARREERRYVEVCSVFVPIFVVVSWKHEVDGGASVLSEGSEVIKSCLSWPIVAQSLGLPPRSCSVSLGHREATVPLLLQIFIPFCIYFFSVVSLKIQAKQFESWTAVFGSQHMQLISSTFNMFTFRCSCLCVRMEERERKWRCTWRHCFSLICASYSVHNQSVFRTQVSIQITLNICSCSLWLVQAQVHQVLVVKHLF